eukprot:3825571-Pyramimonas_sp.AAC.1
MTSGLLPMILVSSAASMSSTSSALRLSLLDVGLALALGAQAEEVQGPALAELAPHGQGLLLGVAREAQERRQRARERARPRNGAAVEGRAQARPQRGPPAGLA